MSDTLPVHLSRDDLHSLEVPPSFETTGSFDVDLRNHGESLHVHLHLDDTLSAVASIEAGNHFVDGQSNRIVRVTVDDTVQTPVHGKLKVVSAYGSQTRYVDVEIVEPELGDGQVRVDESLSKPQSDTSQPEPSSQSLPAGPELFVLLLGVAALLIAFVAAVVTGTTAVVLGALVVVGGVLAAIVFVLR